jgi:cytochrome c oxidase subunit II
VRLRRKLLWLLGLCLLVLLLAACASNAPQDTLRPAGPNARKLYDLFLLPFWVAVGVFVLVEGGFLYISWKYRKRKDRERLPPQTHGNTRLEVGWTILPAVVLAVVVVPAISGIWDYARGPGPGALNITVSGYQWWWEFSYTDDDMKTAYGDHNPITVPDAMVIPVQREVYLTLEAKGGSIGEPNPDFQVIHSFWAPRLFGKQDVVPNHENHILFSADAPGVYWGQCAEFCGLQHGRMKFRIVALDQAGWDAWVANHQRPATEPADPAARTGMDLFLNPLSSGKGTCTACHAIGGTDAAANAAPDLTHFADPSHLCFAGCNWETKDRDALEAWLRDPDAVKLGSKMPDYDLKPEEIDALVAYLYSLT